MAVTKQTYTATATWTPASLASIYRSAFIDAGLMTEWHDSFLSGSVENRILRVQYDAAKTYGTTFYWFQFDTSGACVHLATGWNTSTDVPTGTQYLDYISTTTNSTANHWRFSGTLVNTTSADLIRYSSGTHHWFVSRQGTSASTRQVFSIHPASHPVQPWLDLDRGFYQGWVGLYPGIAGYASAMRFTRGPYLRREVTLGTAYNGATTVSHYTNPANVVPMLCYVAPGNVSNDYNLNFYGNMRADSTTGIGNGIILPTGFTGTNPAYATNSNPVFHSMQYTPYSTTTLNSDFGITFHYATNVFGFQDKFIVTAGVEEWETLAFFNSTIGNGTVASSAFLARVV